MCVVVFGGPWDVDDPQANSEAQDLHVLRLRRSPYMWVCFCRSLGLERVLPARQVSAREVLQEQTTDLLDFSAASLQRYVAPPETQMQCRCICLQEQVLAQG
jgi:hypothetical protein